MKSVVAFLSLALVFTSSAFAADTSVESFVASSVMVQQIKTQGLLGTQQYDALMESALQRVAGTSIELANCEPALGTFGCDLTIHSNQSELKLFVEIHSGTVVSAEVN